MRNYAQEGWITQLQGRRVVGHYQHSARDILTPSGTIRSMSMRNPAVVSATRQRWVHIIRADLAFCAITADDATGSVITQMCTVDGFTATDNAGGAVITPTNLSKSGITPVFEGRSTDTVSGGTLTTIDPAFVLALLSQPATTGVDTFKTHQACWEASYAPILLKGDQGVCLQEIANGFLTPGTLFSWFNIEWLESEKM